MYSDLHTDSDRNIITIRYNILNLPDTIQFLNGNQIINRYASDGRKLETEYFTMITPIIIPIYKDTVYKWTNSSGLVNQTGTVYIDNQEYRIYDGNLQSPYLLKVYNPEGYSESLNGSWTFNYYRKDHLGSIREVWRAAYIRAGGTNIAAATIQQTQYYPSGLPWSEGLNTNQPMLYNGKEFVEMHGLDTYDYGARGYYPALGRFTSIDPLAEKYYSISPYAYCANNPVNMIDPNGMETYTTHDAGEIKDFLNEIKAKYGDDEGDPIPATDQTTAIDNTANKVTRKIEPKQAPEDYSIKPAEKTIFNDLYWVGCSDDPAGQESALNWTKQDWNFTISAIGTIATLGYMGGLLIKGVSYIQYILPLTSLVNSVDDLGKNKKDESITQQMTNNPKTKVRIGNIKAFISIVGVGTSILEPIQTIHSVPKTIATASDFYSTYLYINN